MTNVDLLLISISGLGVLHGIFLMFILLSSPKSQGFSTQKILAFLVIILSLRVGKSVWFYFVEELSLNIIFIGLTLMLAIGPLYLIYVNKLIQGDDLKMKDSIHFIPFIGFLLFGILNEEDYLRKLPMEILVGFFAFFYGHFILYIIFGFKKIRSTSWDNQTVSKKEWLHLLGFALVCVWFVYIINLFEESIPYVLGPILYSIVLYGVTFIAIKKSYLTKINHQKYKSTPLAEIELSAIYDSILSLFTKNESYKNPDLTLDLLSEAFHTTPQKTSMVINQKSGKNFNQFINGFRVEHAKKLLKDSKYDHFTIASIGMEVGFNSINSFNQAFKKETGMTPSEFKKNGV